MATETIGRTQVGPMEKIPNLKSRQRSIYYCPIKQTDGTVQWLETRMLPSDASGRELYLSKGFRLSLPKDEEVVTPPVDDGKEEAYLAEIKALKAQLSMANARSARGKKTS